MKPNSYSQEKDPTYGVNKNRISNLAINALKNTPIDSGQNIPIAQSDHYFCRHGNGRRRYIKAQEVENLACGKYKGNGRGITFSDLLTNGLALNKQQAQTMLKYCIRREILFITLNCKPQQYYPSCLRSEILGAKMSKNIPIHPTGVGLTETSLLNESPIINQSLEGYVLPLLPKTPLHIHKMQFKVKVSPECYNEIALPKCDRNQGKEHVEVIGKARVSYRFYPNGTIMIFTECSNKPFRLEKEADLSCLIAFFGQLRDRLLRLLCDMHERIVPDIMLWELIQCDINKDVKVSDWFQFTALKIQVKHFDHLLRVYFKPMGKETLCRVEEALTPQKPAVQAISDILNPYEKHFMEQDKKLTQIYELVKELFMLLIKSNSLADGRRS